jgi:hypothetical protein
VGNVSSQMVDCRYQETGWGNIELAGLSVMPGTRCPRTLVLTICSRRVLELGRSPAPTRATRDVEKSISTIDVAPSPGHSANTRPIKTQTSSRIHWRNPRSSKWTVCESRLTPCVDATERVTVDDAIPFPGSHANTGVILIKVDKQKLCKGETEET